MVWKKLTDDKWGNVCPPASFNKNYRLYVADNNPGGSLVLANLLPGFPLTISADCSSPYSYCDYSSAPDCNSYCAYKLTNLEESKIYYWQVYGLNQ